MIEKPPVLDAQPAVLGTPAPYPANVYPPTATVPAYSAGPPPYQNPVVIQVAPGIPKRPSFRVQTWAHGSIMMARLSAGPGPWPLC